MTKMRVVSGVQHGQNQSNFRGPTFPGNCVMVGSSQDRNSRGFSHSTALLGQFRVLAALPRLVHGGGLISETCFEKISNKISNS